MKNRIIVTIILALAAVSLSAQKINPESFTRELSGGVGFNTPFSDSNGADAVYWMNYSHYLGRHTGVRFGAQFMPESMGVDGYVGFPVALSLRTGMRQTSDAYVYGGVLALDLLDAFIWDDGDFFTNALAVFLLSLVNRAEFFVGLTPGYVYGSSHLYQSHYYGADGNRYNETYGTRKAHSLYCSADAGINLSWRIWRFTLNMTPAVHYNVTGNYHAYSANEETIHPQDRPVRWFFGMNFGLGYLF